MLLDFLHKSNTSIAHTVQSTYLQKAVQSWDGILYVERAEINCGWVIERKLVENNISWSKVLIYNDPENWKSNPRVCKVEFQRAHQHSFSPGGNNIWRHSQVPNIMQSLTSMLSHGNLQWLPVVIIHYMLRLLHLSIAREIYWHWNLNSWQII